LNYAITPRRHRRNNDTVSRKYDGGVSGKRTTTDTNCSIRLQRRRYHRDNDLSSMPRYHWTFMEFENVMMYIRAAPVSMPTFCNSRPMYAAVLLSIRFSSIMLFISGVWEKQKPTFHQYKHGKVVMMVVVVISRGSSNAAFAFRFIRRQKYVDGCYWNVFRRVRGRRTLVSRAY